MTKEFFNEEIGGDGGKVAGGMDEGGLLKLEFSYPAVKLIQPALAKVKEWIPGTKYDGYVDTLAAAIFGWLGLEIPKPEIAPAPAVPEAQG